MTSPDSYIITFKLCWDQGSLKDLGLSAVVWELRQQSLTVPVPVVQFALSGAENNLNQDKLNGGTLLWKTYGFQTWAKFS